MDNWWGKDVSFAPGQQDGKWSEPMSYGPVALSCSGENRASSCIGPRLLHAGGGWGT